MPSTEHKTALVDTDASGKFLRKDSKFRSFVSADGSTGFKAEAGRYHLYISLACPWAHRTYIYRKLKGLEQAIGLSIVHWYMGPMGWTFDHDPSTIPDTVNNVNLVRELYFIANPDYDGRFTVPVLWDKQNKTIVNNESSEIIRMLNSEFNAFATNPQLDLYPKDLQAEINKWNDYIYPNINNGVYRTGFATKQDAYEEAFGELFGALDKVDAHLANSRFLVGNTLTEADIRLFTTLIRFDPVYFGHFKCNWQQIKDYPNLSGYVRDIYQFPGIKETVDFHHIKSHYYGSHERINPNKIVPKGPAMAYIEQANNRAEQFST
eukprot:CAMPEP_0184658952 /NCGR_PEP_ID=MMETSP0308-20130426/27478_1 /TAXON_ID=38269 /ORGANISM="Gloeochaete witrockiana, Strain SAG 46.84" /LENGTH=320 /DNA_ID=CAMNT_0027098327 /DNA_START=142 /DNA_END=1104 /DNA_ORIENTATION=-